MEKPSKIVGGTRWARGLEVFITPDSRCFRTGKRTFAREGYGSHNLDHVTNLSLPGDGEGLGPMPPEAAGGAGEGHSNWSQR